MILLPVAACGEQLGADLLFGWDWLASDKSTTLKWKEVKGVRCNEFPRFFGCWIIASSSFQPWKFQIIWLYVNVINKSLRDWIFQNCGSPSLWDRRSCSFAVGASANSWLHCCMYFLTQESGKLSDCTARRNATASAMMKINGVSKRKMKSSTNH